MNNKDRIIIVTLVSLVLILLIAYVAKGAILKESFAQTDRAIEVAVRCLNIKK